MESITKLWNKAPLKSSIMWFTFVNPLPQILSIRNLKPKTQNNMCLNIFGEGKVIAEIFSAPWHNLRPGGVVQCWGETSPLPTKRGFCFWPVTSVCFRQHRLTCFSIWNAKWVLIDGSKGIFKFGILGTREHGLLSLLGFPCPSVQELGFIQDQAVAALPQECFHRPGSLMSSFHEVDGVVGPCKWPLRGSCFCWDDWHFNQHNVSIFSSLSTLSSLPPSLLWASFHTSCEAFSVYIITSVYPSLVYVYLELSCISRYFSMCATCHVPWGEDSYLFILRIL